MSILHNRFRQVLGYAGGGALILLVVAIAENRPVRARDAGVAPSVSGKTDTSPKPPTVKENVKKLGQEIVDPTTPARIKAHEQELEKKIERTRDRQRKDHGKAKPGDAVDLAKSLDSTSDADGKAKVEDKSKPDGKTKVEEKPKADGKAQADGKAKAEGK